MANWNSFFSKFKKQPLTEKPKKGIIREYVESLLTALLLAFLIRSFVVEPFKIPSKSMVPTLLVGDHIFVNKFAYGWRLPLTKYWLTHWGDPARGDVIVFIYPEDESLDFIKRVVGLPGDKIHMEDGKLTVNGESVNTDDIPIVGVDPDNSRVLREAISENAPPENPLGPIPFTRGFENYKIQKEDLLGINHFIQRSRLLPNNDPVDLTVPEGHYFVMGDNRDQSADSRVWGFVPRENLKGKAFMIWLSLDNDRGGIRLGRFGRKIL